ncbi:hypothetical protein XENOCAPTIV_019404 [Xenoophorus captivus]|uniref:Ileal sodium/bile acid cotransporter n=1 Tax=Xenoophorus captivus TaxID=1517983 RepID=A0ABV0RI45_9TELE
MTNQQILAFVNVAGHPDSCSVTAGFLTNVQVPADAGLSENKIQTEPSGANCLIPPSNFNAVLGLVMSTVLTVMLALVMFAMGCTVEASKLWSHVKKPWGIVIGFLCQFGIMPFTAFALSLAFGVLPVQAIVIIVMGCCPGGSSSNIICYWLDGDMDLR